MLTLATVLPAAAMLSYFWCRELYKSNEGISVFRICPESLHWYVVNNKEKEAIQWIHKAQKVNKVTFAIDDVRFSEKKVLSTMVKEALK